jgi:hypothetical protein
MVDKPEEDLWKWNKELEGRGDEISRDVGQFAAEAIGRKFVQKRKELIEQIRFW